jgi:Arc/MetJ family transcription regulator
MPSAHITYMNRTDVTVDVDLLEEALKVTGESTSDAVVDKALAELLRIARLKRGIQALRDTDDVFWPGYLEEIRPNSWTAYEMRKAAYEGRTTLEDPAVGHRSD